MADAASLDLLPPVARDLAECIGLEATLALAQRWGGLRIWIPANPGAELIALLGAGPALKLCQTYTNERIELPRCVRQLRAVRDRAILAALQGNSNANQAALGAGLTRRQIFNIKRKAADLEPDPHLDMWGG